MTKHEKSHSDIDPKEFLRQLGWNDFCDRSIAELPETKKQIARVVSVRRGFFLVSDGRSEWLCPPSGRLLNSGYQGFPVTGDWVLTDGSVVYTVLPRKNLLARGEAGSRNGRTGFAQREQAIAANIDTAFIVCGLDRDFNVRRLERYLTLVHSCGISPVVVLTKADLHESTATFRQDVENIAFGTSVVVTSMLDGRGTDELAAWLGHGQTVTMLGSSGAGKSTLVNLLCKKDIQATGDVSTSIGKGRHTTTVRELIAMPQGGLLMDNPGIREIAFHSDGGGMENSFADIRELAEGCRFADCTHQHEPGCAVRKAVDIGTLSPDRLENFHKMERELRYLSDRNTKSADRIEKERWKDVSKLIRHINKRR